MKRFEVIITNNEIGRTVRIPVSRFKEASKLFHNIVANICCSSIVFSVQLHEYTGGKWRLVYNHDPYGGPYEVQQ